jgi:hypothetical protein
LSSPVAAITTSLEVPSLPLDQQHLVAGVEQLLGDRATDIAGSGNPDPQLPLGHMTIFAYVQRALPRRQAEILTTQ